MFNNNNNNNNNKLKKNNNTDIINDNFINRIRIFLLLIFVGYFGIKIILAPFGIYPNKYNYKTLDLRGTNIDKNILYDLDVSANCKKVFFYNMSYCVLSGLFVLINTFPFTDNGAAGLVWPIPTLPFPANLTLSDAVLASVV